MVEIFNMLVSQCKTRLRAIWWFNGVCRRDCYGPEYVSCSSATVTLPVLLHPSNGFIFIELPLEFVFLQSQHRHGLSSFKRLLKNVSFFGDKMSWVSRISYLSRRLSSSLALASLLPPPAHSLSCSRMSAYLTLSPCQHTPSSVLRKRSARS